MAYKQILDVNHLFRDSVLRFFTSAEPFAAPCLDPEPTPGAVPHRAAKSLVRSLTGNSLPTPSQDDDMEDEDDDFESPVAPEQGRQERFSPKSSECSPMSSPTRSGAADAELEKFPSSDQEHRSSTHQDAHVIYSHDRPVRRRCVTLHPGAEVQWVPDPHDRLLS